MSIKTHAMVALLAASLASVPAGAADSASGAATQAQPDGVVRVSGSREMAPVLKALAAEFARLQPSVRIVDRLRGEASGIYGLEQRTSDLVLMGRNIHPFERYGIYERSWTYPVGIEIATGGLAGNGAAYVAVVHRSNPLTQLTLQQLDGVFGAERSGGWDKLAWNPGAARGGQSDVRKWEQLGVRGTLVGRRITPYGEAHIGAGAITDFQEKVMQGGASWNEDLREFSTRDALLTALAKDPAGLAVTTAGPLPAGLKAVPLLAGPGGKSLSATRETLVDRSYPLARPVYAFVSIDDVEGDVASPRVSSATAAFLRFVLSAAGQRIVAENGNLLPLAPAAAQKQVAILDARDWPEERPRP